MVWIQKKWQRIKWTEEIHEQRNSFLPDVAISPIDIKNESTCWINLRAYCFGLNSWIANHLSWIAHKTRSDEYKNYRKLSSCSSDCSKLQIYGSNGSSTSLILVILFCACDRNCKCCIQFSLICENGNNTSSSNASIRTKWIHFELNWRLKCNSSKQTKCQCELKWSKLFGFDKFFFVVKHLQNTHTIQICLVYLQYSKKKFSWFF